MNVVKKIVPKLQFPEFRGGRGEWRGVPLSELVDSLDAGVSVNSGDRPATGDEIGVLKTSAVTGGIFEPQENKVVFDEFEKGRVKETVQGGTIIISRMNTPALVGANAYVETSLENIYLPDRLWAAKSKSGTSMRFVASILGSDKGRAALSKLAKGSSGSMKNITKPDVFSLLIAAPLPAEQQKIADCLSSLDELIAAQARKVDSLKTHKKGLMQQLFPREGETQPCLRFPEFQDAKEWEEDTLDDIATFRRGSFPQPYGLPEWYDEKNGMPFIQVFDVGDDFRLKDKTKSRISKLGAKKSVFIPEGTLIVTLQGSIGRVAITHYDAYIDRTLLIFESFQKPIEKIFFSRVVQNLFDIEKEKAPGGIIKTITKASLSDFKVKYPKIDEQQRIATCLSSLDTLITNANQELEALKTHKKGLMQQLFPSAEGIQA